MMLILAYTSEIVDYNYGYTYVGLLLEIAQKGT